MQIARASSLSAWLGLAAAEGAVTRTAEMTPSASRALVRLDPSGRVGSTRSFPRDDPGVTLPLAPRGAEAGGRKRTASGGECSPTADRLLFPDPAQQVNLVPAPHAELRGSPLEVDLGGQQDRLAELDIDLV